MIDMYFFPSHECIESDSVYMKICETNTESISLEDIRTTVYKDETGNVLSKPTLEFNVKFKEL